MGNVEFVARENGNSKQTYVKRLNIKAITGREDHELLFGEDLQKIREALTELGFDDIQNLKLL